MLDYPIVMGYRQMHGYTKVRDHPKIIDCCKMMLYARMLDYPKVLHYLKTLDCRKILEYPKMMLDYPNMLDYPEMLDYPKVMEDRIMMDYPKMLDYPTMLDSPKMPHEPQDSKPGSPYPQLEGPPLVHNGAHALQMSKRLIHMTTMEPSRGFHAKPHACIGEPLESKPACSSYVTMLHNSGPITSRDVLVCCR